MLNDDSRYDKITHRILNGIYCFNIQHEWISETYLKTHALSVLLKNLNHKEYSIRNEIELCLFTLLQSGKTIKTNSDIVISIYEEDSKYLQINLIKILLEVKICSN